MCNRSSTTLTSPRTWRRCCKGSRSVALQYLGFGIEGVGGSICPRLTNSTIDYKTICCPSGQFWFMKKVMKRYRCGGAGIGWKTCAELHFESWTASQQHRFVHLKLLKNYRAEDLRDGWGIGMGLEVSLTTLVRNIQVNSKIMSHFCFLTI